MPVYGKVGRSPVTAVAPFPPHVEKDQFAWIDDVEKRARAHRVQRWKDGFGWFMVALFGALILTACLGLLSLAVL